MKIKFTDKDAQHIPEEITYNDVSFVRKDLVSSAPKKKEVYENVFDCKNIEDLFDYDGEDLETFKIKYSNLSPKKLNLELIEKGIEIIRGNWKPTPSNIWYYPYFERTKDGAQFVGVDYVSVFYTVVGSSLVLENSEQAELVGTILLPQYNIYMMP